jgi:hypothetical protein
MRPTLADMVRLQLETGMRPGELCVMRAVDIDMTTLPDAIRQRLDAIAIQAQTGADALDSDALDLPEAVLAEIDFELTTLDGRLALLLDRLATALDPVAVTR